MMEKTIFIAALLACLTAAAAPTPDDKPDGQVPTAEVTCGNLLGSGVVRVILAFYASEYPTRLHQVSGHQCHVLSALIPP
jgi:hypothetical protein